MYDILQINGFDVPLVEVLRVVKRACLNRGYQDADDVCQEVLIHIIAKHQTNPDYFTCKEGVLKFAFIGAGFVISRLFRKHRSRKDYDLLLMSSMSDANGIPTAGKSLIIVAIVNLVLHFRIFGSYRELVVDTDAKRLANQARQIEELREQLESLWPPHELTKLERARVIKAVTTIVGQDPQEGPRSRFQAPPSPTVPPNPIDDDTRNRLLLLLSDCKRLVSWLADADPAVQDVFRLHQCEQMSTSDIHGNLGLSLSSIYRYLKAANKILKPKLAAYLET